MLVYQRVSSISHCCASKENALWSRDQLAAWPLNPGIFLGSGLSCELPPGSDAWWLWAKWFQTRFQTNGQHFRLGEIWEGELGNCKTIHFGGRKNGVLYRCESPHDQLGLWTLGLMRWWVPSRWRFPKMYPKMNCYGKSYSDGYPLVMTNIAMV